MKLFNSLLSRTRQRKGPDRLLRGVLVLRVGRQAAGADEVEPVLAGGRAVRQEIGLRVGPWGFCTVFSSGFLVTFRGFFLLGIPIFAPLQTQSLQKFNVEPSCKMFIS